MSHWTIAISQLCLGLDSGTTSCKALVLDIESGKVVAQANAPHIFIDGLAHGHVEQDPQTWIDAAEKAISVCLEKIGEQRARVASANLNSRRHRGN